MKFINESEDSDDLIKKSRIVATITGLVGYEALLLGKPCVYFRRAWYEGLPNAFRFNDTLDLEEISLHKGDIQEMGKALDAKMARAADAVVFPKYMKLMNKDANWPNLMRMIAKSLLRIGDAANSISADSGI